MTTKKKAAPKKSAPKKSGAKKSGAKKAGAKKAGAKKAGAKKAEPAKPAAKKAKRKKRAGAKRERVLVTGAAGSLGRLLCRKLHRHFDVIGVDRRPFPDRPKDVEHLRLDLRRKSSFQQLKKLRPDLMIHMGVIHNPQSGEAFHFNVEGTSQLLRLAEALKLRKFVFLSSANLYGPSARTSGFLTEESPLMAADKSPGVRDLISLDMMVQSFFWKRPETDTVILRPVHIVGPHLRNAPSKYFRLKSIPTILGFDPMVQLVHELDVVDALIAATRPDLRGVFNIVGNGQAPLSRLIEARGNVAFPVPGPVLKGTLDRMFRYHLTNFPSAELDHLRYSCLVDGTRAREELGFTPQMGLKASLQDL